MGRIVAQGGRVTDILAFELLLPAVGLGLLGWLVPRLWGWILPEGVGPLLWNAGLSTVTLWALSAGAFILLYMVQGAPAEDLLAQDRRAVLLEFGGLGLSAGLIWAPVMLLSLAGLPKTWKTVQW